MNINLATSRTARETGFERPRSDAPDICAVSVESARLSGLKGVLGLVLRYGNVIGDNAPVPVADASVGAGGCYLGSTWSACSRIPPNGQPVSTR